jgi:hypothetical protein
LRDEFLDVGVYKYLFMAESAYSSNNQFAGLVEAASAAAGQEVAWSHNVGAAASANQVLEGDESYAGFPRDTSTSLHGQYGPTTRSVHSGDAPQATSRTNTRKRKRGVDSPSTQNGFTEEQEATQATENQSSPPRNPASVHSAAALFRAPSKSSKKYTRPPMSKVFSSLQLPPEEFLHLQSAAKAYMLDDDHPERRDCVGQRGKTDSDMVKLKVWKCVQLFLEMDGNGERFFGVDAPRADGEDGARSMVWPENALQVIKTCIPLFRRMVTNERQRQYAVETRKGGGESKKDKHVIDANESGHKPVRATIEDTDNPGTFTTEKIDMFGDGLLAESPEASEWYNIYNSDAVLDKIFIKSRFPRVLFLPMITNIDGHCRHYHGAEGPLCSEACKTRLIEKIVDLPVYRRHAPGGDPQQTVREAFNVILTHLILTSYWKTRGNKETASSSATGVPHGRGSSLSNRTESWDIGTTTRSAAANTQATHDLTLESSLQLLIHIVHEDKCVLPPFHIPSDQCANLDALRMQIAQHYSLAVLQEKRVIPLSEAMLKVWLPDGLVRVADDGQWMVALLSAGRVEWMGRQLRVLFET